MLNRFHFQNRCHKNFKNYLLFYKKTVFDFINMLPMLKVTAVKALMVNAFVYFFQYLQNAKLAKRQVEKMVSWQKDRLIKWQVDKKTNGKLTKCH